MILAMLPAAASAQSQQAAPDRWAVGPKVGSPEVVSLELLRRLSGTWMVRGFIAPPVTLKLRRKVPEETILAGLGMRVLYPAVEEDVAVTLGPQIGLDVMGRPLEKRGLYLFGGLARRELRGKGGSMHPLIIDGLLGRRETRAQFGADVDYRSTGWLLRAGAGWMWRIGERGHVDAVLGAAKTVSAKRDADVETHADMALRNPGLSAAAARMVERASQESVRRRVLETSRKDEERPVPIVGVGVGLSF